MNRYSRTVTQPKSQGASQAMLYATDGVHGDEDFEKAMVGIASVWCVIYIRLRRHMLPLERTCFR